MYFCRLSPRKSLFRIILRNSKQKIGKCYKQINTFNKIVFGQGGYNVKHITRLPLVTKTSFSICCLLILHCLQDVLNNTRLAD